MREVLIEFMGGNHALPRLNAPAAILWPPWAVGGGLGPIALGLAVIRKRARLTFWTVVFVLIPRDESMLKKPDPKGM